MCTEKIIINIANIKSNNQSKPFNDSVAINPTRAEWAAVKINNNIGTALAKPTNAATVLILPKRRYLIPRIGCF